MKIAVDCREMEGRPTGVGRYLTEILKNWNSAALGKNEIFLYFKSGIPADPFLTQSSFKKKILSRFAFMPDIFWEQVFLPLELKRDGIDVFWGPNGACSFFAASVRKVVNIHDLTFFKKKDWFSSKERFTRRWKASLSARAAHTLITISEATREDLERLFPMTKQKTRVIYGGADHWAIESNAKTASRVRVLFVGSIFERRPVEGLIRAITLLKKKHKSICLTIIGDNRTLPKKDFAGLVRDLGLEGDVFLKGYVDDRALRDAYAQGGIFCFPSLYEGFGIPIVEAQRYGLPVVTLANSSLTEVGGDSVAYAASEHAEDLAKTIDRLLCDQAYYMKLRKKGFQNSRRFRWETASKELRTILSF